MRISQSSIPLRKVGRFYFSYLSKQDNPSSHGDKSMNSTIEEVVRSWNFGFVWYLFWSSIDLNANSPEPVSYWKS